MEESQISAWFACVASIVLGALDRIVILQVWLHLGGILCGDAEGPVYLCPRHPFSLVSLVCGAVLFLAVTAAAHPKIMPGLQSRLSVHGGIKEAVGSVSNRSFWSTVLGVRSMSAVIGKFTDGRVKMAIRLDYKRNVKHHWRARAHICDTLYL